jgi:aminoglycoside phosphotransferase (APT) family kinase protein
MEFAEGDCVEPSVLPEGEELPPAEVRGRELEAARLCGVLHALDPAALGLGDEPVVSPEEELDRWVKSFERCDEDIQEGHAAVRDQLAASIPALDRSSLVHGDWRLGNTLSKGHDVIAVIDWEIWSVADSRVDLAWYLMMCNPDPILERRTVDGMPSNEELLDVYQKARGVQLQDMFWFDALVRYKQSAITGLIIRNARRQGHERPLDGMRKLLKSANAMLAGA